MITGVETGELFRAWRESLGLTQEGMSEKSGISRGHIGDYECGRSSPRIKTVLKFIAAVEAAKGPLGSEESDRLSEFFAGPDSVAQEERADRALRELRRGKRGRGRGR